jgi:hypothetical protein
MDTFNKFVLRDRLATLAAKGVFVGTSSWKLEAIMRKRGIAIALDTNAQSGQSENEQAPG